jgi:hypothetical protein
MSPAAEAMQAARCLAPTPVTGHWTGVVKASTLLQQVKALTAAGHLYQVPSAVTGAIESCSDAAGERHGLVSVLSDVLIAAVQLLDVEAIGRHHESRGVRDAECVLRFERRRAASKAESAAHARAVKAAKRAAARAAATPQGESVA